MKMEKHVDKCAVRNAVMCFFYSKDATKPNQT